MKKDTLVSDKIIDRILSEYGFGSLMSKKIFSTGTVQENILVYTNDGAYVFKFYKSRSEEYVKFELSLIEYLNNKNYSCPTIYRTKNGKLFDLIDNKVIAVYEFVNGDHKTVLKYEHLDQLIEKISELHSITKDLKPEGYENRWNYGLEFCEVYIANNLKNKTDDNSKLKKHWLLNELDSLILTNELSKGIVHGDLDPSNIIFEKDKIKAIIDFDDSNYTYLVFDIIGLIDRKNYRFLGHKYFELIRYVIDRYEKHNSLSDADKFHFFDVLKLSIMIDCFWFFDRGKFSNFIEKEKIDKMNNIGRNQFYQKLLAQ